MVKKDAEYELLLQQNEHTDGKITLASGLILVVKC